MLKSQNKLELNLVPVHCVLWVMSFIHVQEKGLAKDYWYFF